MESEHRNTVERLVRLMAGQVACAEIGVHSGKTSARILGIGPHVFLHMIDSWAETDPGSDYHKTGDPDARFTQNDHDQHKQAAIECTDFARDRRHLICADSVGAMEQSTIGDRVRAPVRLQHRSAGELQGSLCP